MTPPLQTGSATRDGEANRISIQIPLKVILIQQILIVIPQNVILNPQIVIMILSRRLILESESNLIPQKVILICEK